MCITAFPLLVVAFTNHYNTLSFYQQLENRSFGLLWKCSVVTFTLVFVIYLSIGLGGYSFFGDDVEANVLNSFPDGNVLAALGRLGFGCTIIFSYPLVHHNTSKTLLNSPVNKPSEICAQSAQV